MRKLALILLLFLPLGLSAQTTQVIVRDTFSRANSGNLGANWTANSDAISTGTLGIVSNAAQPSVGANSASFWNANSFTANQYSELVIQGSASGSGSQIIGPTVHDSAGGYYRFTYNTSNSDPSVQIAKVVSGTFTSLGAVAHGSCALGSLLRLEIIGTQITGYCNGTQMIQVTDSALATGSPGIAGFMSGASPPAFTQHWSGGNLVWTRRGTVIPIGAGGGTEEPSVLYRPNCQIVSPNVDGNCWKMWFTNGWSGVINVFYAESNDAITWTQYSGNPVIYDGVNNALHGFVFHSGSTYYGYIGTSSGAGNGTSTALDQWTSSDGINWTKAHSSVLAIGGVGAWDHLQVADPVVWIATDGTWKMLYQGRSVTVYSTGLATSSDGVTWTKDGANPVITATGSSLNGKNVVQVNGTTYLWGGTSPTGNLPTDISLWKSTDLHTWTACSKNPIYERVLANEGAGVSSGQVADAMLVEVAGTTYLFYDAIDVQAASKIHINMANTPFTILGMTQSIFGDPVTTFVSGQVGAFLVP